MKSYQKFEFSQLLQRFSQVHALCLGDGMLDCFVEGSVSAISPEAPVPILRKSRQYFSPGGAGNTCHNMASLGARVSLLSVCGQDQEAETLKTLLQENPRITECLVTDPLRPTTFKKRYVAHGQQLLRVDREVTASINEAAEHAILENLKKTLPQSQVLVLSDYAKGVLTPSLTQAAITLANAHQCPVIVDPKGANFLKYKGATVLTPNLKELSLATGITPSTVEEIAALAQRLRRHCKVKALIVTCGAQGMVVVKGTDFVHIPTQAKEVFDVSGAGDTVVATLALAYAAGGSLYEAAALSNIAAGISVSKVGTAVVRPEEILQALEQETFSRSNEKVVSLEAALERVQIWQRQGKKVGFTNGCFDLLHKGHISLLDQARSQCDALVVGLNTDSSIKLLKGSDRPIQDQAERALVLSCLSQVDLVVLFEAETPIELIKTLRPDVLVKGADYALPQIVGADFVQSYGGKVYRASLVLQKSTSQTIQKMKIAQS